MTSTSSSGPQKDSFEELNKTRLEDRLHAIKTKEQETVARQLAKKKKLPYIDLTIAPIESSAVWSVDEAKARQAKLVVLHTMKKDDLGSAQVAVADPDDPGAQKILAELKQKFSHLNLFLCSQRSLEIAWSRYLDKPSGEKNITGEVDVKIEKIEEFKKKINSVDNVTALIKEAPQEKASEILELIIAGALQFNASDVHLEAREKSALLRYRIDGILQEVVEFSLLSFHILINRVKLLSEMKLNRQDIAQDGRFTILFGELKIEVRVSVIPGAYGENAVVRILNPKTISLGLKDLGFREDEMELMTKEIKKPNGMIITTGPTGSGKTTALYTFIKEVANPEVKVITLEDPIEYHLPLITQTQIEPERGYTFAAGLRAILRQDPDIILVGEIRDKETAEIAIHAALTGHLVFSTLHTNDAAGAVPRLVEMGANPAILSAALNVVLAQRLARRLCSACRQEIVAAGEDKDFLSKTIDSFPAALKEKYQRSEFKIFQPQGCPQCNNTGYKGRIGIFEIIFIDDDLEKLVASSPSHAELKEAAAQKNMTTMIQDGVIKVVDGVTSLEEIKSVIGD